MVRGREIIGGSRVGIRVEMGWVWDGVMGWLVTGRWDWDRYDGIVLKWDFERKDVSLNKWTGMVIRLIRIPHK